MICRMILFFAAALSVGQAHAAGVKTGQSAPEFSLPGSDGKTYKLSQFKGKTVVLEWFNPECPFVDKFYSSTTMQKLQKEEMGKGVVWLSILSSAEGKEGHLTAPEAEKVRQEKGMNSTALLLDGKGQVGREYAAKTTPHMYIIDKAGKVVYQGAIDDRPSANPKSLEGAQNYVSAALASMAKGEAIKNATTAPYGCSVKY